MNRQIARVILGLTAVAACSLATAKLQAPDHVIYGNATIFGVDAPLGSVIELREMDGDVLARYELGRESRLGNQYALYIPMDTVDPLSARTPMSSLFSMMQSSIAMLDPG